MDNTEIDKMAMIAYNSASGDAAGTPANFHNNIGQRAERSAASPRIAPSPPAALSQGQGNADTCSRPSAQRSCNTGSGSLAVGAPSLEAAEITLRSRRFSSAVRSRRAPKVRQEDRGGQLFNIFPDGTSAPADPDYNPYRDSFVVAVQQATGLIKGGKTLPLDAITVLLTRIVVHMGEKERSCRLYRLPVVLALMGMPDENGIAPDRKKIEAIANRTEIAIAAAIRSLCNDRGEMESLARRRAGVQVREIRTTKGGK